jgi:hypothetical protein
VLSNQNFAGVFVAHKTFVEFFKSSNRMIEMSNENVAMNDDDDDDDEWISKIEKITTCADNIFFIEHPIP